MEEETIMNPDSGKAMPEGHDDQAHNEHVRDLALILFDRTRLLHELNESSRRVMEKAALFHHYSPGSIKKKDEPVRALRKVLQKQLAPEMKEEELEALAVIIATHQGKIKRKDYNRLNISPAQQREALTVASLLRIASGLDDSRSQSTTIQQVEPEREQIWVVVDGPHAAADASVAQHNARLWKKIGYPQTRMLESAEAAKKLLPYPSPTETTGITATDTLAEAGRKVMCFHFARMLANEKGTRLGEDIEALHDMRVAARRLRAAFEVFGEAFETGALKGYLKGLRATGRALGNVRDLDVFMEKARTYQATLPEDQQPGLEPLFLEWEAQRKRARSEMLAFLDSQEYHSFKRQFNIFLHTPGAGARLSSGNEPLPRLVCELAPVLIYTRLAAVRAFDPFIAGAPIERLHALRIEFKQLRYAVEYFREVLAKQAEDIITELRGLQDHLGDLNDAHVASQMIETFILEQADQENVDVMRAYLTARQEERRRLLESFPARWEQFNRAELRRKLASALAVL
jgi:CHAD domain-containing protein